MIERCLIFDHSDFFNSLSHNRTLALQHFDELSTYENSSRRALAFCKSGVSNPSVNQSYTRARRLAGAVLISILAHEQEVAAFMTSKPDIGILRRLLCVQHHGSTDLLVQFDAIHGIGKPFPSIAPPKMLGEAIDVGE